MPLVSEIVHGPLANVVPTSCPICGMPTTIRVSLTGLSCSDPRCPSKIAQRLVALADRADILGIGDSIALKIVLDNNLSNPLQLFNWLEDNPNPLYEGSGGSLEQEVAIKLGKLLSYTYTTADYVCLLFLPGIQGSTARDVFGNDDLAEILGIVDSEQGYDFIRERLGVKAEVSQRVLNVQQVLVEFKQDILSYSSLFDFQVSSFESLNVCISDSPGPGWPTKRAFMDEASVYAEQCGYYINWVSSVTGTTDYLVHGGGRVTVKLRKAESKGIPVVTGAEFLEGLL